MHWQTATATLLQPVTSRDRLGLVTDVDGTISQIVDQPDAAQVTPRSRDLLHALHARLALVAVVSGRGVADVRRMVGLPELTYVGNHGLEWWRDGQVALAPETRAYRPALEAAIHALSAYTVPGMIVEDKIATISVHYRQTANPTATAAALAPVLERIAAGQRLRLFQGRMIFELRPPVDTNKGSAFRQLVDEHDLGAAIYLGDDTTDVDALRMARELRDSGRCYALGLGVESEHMPTTVRDHADLLIGGVHDVEAFLAWLLTAVSASST